MVRVLGKPCLFATPSRLTSRFAPSERQWADGRDSSTAGCDHRRAGVVFQSDEAAVDVTTQSLPVGTGARGGGDAAAAHHVTAPLAAVDDHEDDQGGPGARASRNRCSSGGRGPGRRRDPGRFSPAPSPRGPFFYAEPPTPLRGLAHYATKEIEMQRLFALAQEGRTAESAPAADSDSDL